MKRLTCICLFYVLLSCDSTSQSTPVADKHSVVTLEGSAFYRERIALPPGSSLTLALVDISQQKVKPDIIAQKTRQLHSAPPYAFSLEIPKNKLQKTHQYALKAEVLHNKKPIFATHLRINPLESKTKELSLLLKKVPQKETASLLNQQLKANAWQLIEIEGDKVDITSTIPAPYIQFSDGNRLHGFSGCNQFTGKYLLNDRQIALRPKTVTNKACFKMLVDENTFLTTLKNTAFIKVSDNHLMLVSSGKKVIAVFTGKVTSQNLHAHAK